MNRREDSSGSRLVQKGGRPRSLAAAIAREVIGKATVRFVFVPVRITVASGLWRLGMRGGFEVMRGGSWLNETEQGLVNREVRIAGG